MDNQIIGGKECKFNDTLRVLYTLRASFKVKTFTEVMDKLKNPELEDQLKVLYASYSAATNTEVMNEEEFTNLCLDNLGIMCVANLTGEIISGLVYTGMSDEDKEIAEKKAQATLFPKM